MKKRFLSGKIIRAIVGTVLTLSLAFGTAAEYLPGAVLYTEARNTGGRLIRLDALKKLAVLYSEKIEALDIQIDSKKAAKESSLRSLREKERNMKTFRWSPLINFKFPTKADEAEAFEFAYKPVQLQYEIDTLKHKITDEKLKAYEKISQIYIKIITSTAEATFLEKRIDNLETAIAKNKAKVAEGTATQAQVDQQIEKLDGFKEKLANEETKLLEQKKKIQDETGLDVSSGYRFEDAFVSASMARDNIEYLQAIALENDQTVFEAKQSRDLAQLALMTNYNLMMSQYGGKMSSITKYVQQALDGSKINKRAFKSDYDAMLKDVDAPWQGSYRILFFKFPKEWFKGAIDGIRYVEDDPYVLYSAALDYESALKEYNSAVNELKSAVEEGYSNFIQTRKAYLTAIKELDKLENQLLYDEALNAIGELSFDEYNATLNEHESAISALKDALALYSTTLFEFDRTCCGGVTQYLSNESLTAKVGPAGLGTPDEAGNNLEKALDDMEPIVKKGAIYSIKYIVDSQEFLLYVDIPDDFEYKITDFELWSDKTKIGEKTKVGDALRHLHLSVQDVEAVKIRLFNGDEFIDDCTIDPEVTYGPLNITVGYADGDKDIKKEIGSYTVEDDTNTEMIKLRFTFDQKAVEDNFALGEEVAFYNISAERNLYLFSDELVPQDQAFSYMSFIKSDIDSLTLRMFSEDGTYIGGANFDAKTMKLYADKDITQADMQEIAARAVAGEKKAGKLQEEQQRLKDLLAVAEAANHEETDTETISYYKNRIAELQEQIDNIDATITDEEISDSLKENPTEIARRVSEMSTDSESGTSFTGSGLTPAEQAARAAILEKEARDLVIQKRIEDQKNKIQNNITDKKKELAELQNQLKKAKRNTDYYAILRQITAVKKEIALNEEKLKSAGNNVSRDVTDEEIQKAILENGEEIYAAAEEMLSDAMLYGSDVGQWAVAYLEEKGFDTGAENMRKVVQNADTYKAYQKNIERKENLEENIKNAKERMKEFEGKTGTSDSNLYAQLQKMVKAYENELKKLEKDIQRTDPTKDLK